MFTSYLGLRKHIVISNLEQLTYKMEIQNLSVCSFPIPIMMHKTRWINMSSVLAMMKFLAFQTLTSC
jgi:hypothetical protein